MDDKGARLVKSGTYDQMYESHDTTYENPRRSQYYPMFRAAVASLKAMRIHSVLEVGCGSGVLAEMILQNTMAYRGFDISPVGVAKAKARNSHGDFFVGDATDPNSYRSFYDGVLCCEVLEHIDNDRAAVELWKPGTPVVCSVPNFDYYSHVRFFDNEAAVRDRYGDLIDIQRILRINKPAFSIMSSAAYLNKIKWAAMKGQFRQAAGLMGINQFSWYGGWFLFQGLRRKS